VSTQPSDGERAAWHKRFAAECNNRAWDLSTAERSPADDREMLDVAHAAAWHWGKVGTELNRMRATMLLAEVHALLGMGERALAHAEESPDWEIAFSHAIYAHAAHVAGRAAEHRDAYAQAEAALAAIADDEDRAIVAATFRHVPLPA